jgi:hypothetical protein
MQRLVLAVLVCIPLAAMAGEANPQFSGSLGDNDTSTFFVRPTSDNESWWFKIPDGDYFWLKTQDSTGTELEDTDLSDHRSVTLVGAKGRKVIFRIYEIGGNGPWSAWKGDGPSSADERVVFSAAAPTSRPDAQFSGTLGDNDTAEFFVRPESDRESWWFQIPDGDFFWVKTQDSTGREYQDTDLSDHQSVTLVGAKGRKVIFRIYEIAGNGAWSAWKGTGPAAANEDAVFAVSKPEVNAQPSPGQLLKPGADGKFSGYLDEDDSTSFAVKPESDLEHWRFQIPDGKYFWLKVMIDGVERDDIDLSDYGSVTLKGAKGQDIVLTIYQIGGVGNWSAWKAADAADQDHVFDLAGETSDGEVDSELDDEELYQALADLFAGDSEGLSGSLTTGTSDTIVITTESDSEDWVFAIPDGAKFKVKVLAANGDVLRDVDLAQSNRVTLEGKGEHKLVIRAKSGSGDWSARKVE